MSSNQIIYPLLIVTLPFPFIDTWILSQCQSPLGLVTYVDVREPDVLGSVGVEEDVVVQVGCVSRKEMGHLRTKYQPHYYTQTFYKT